MREVRILSPNGILGYGFPEASFARGLASRPDAIAVDAGSTDAGPHKLGAGEGIVTREATHKDLVPMLRGARELGVPLLIGSAGGAGAREHVAWTMEIVEDIVREQGLAFETAIIHADVPRDTLHAKLDRGQIRPLGPAPELDHAGIDAATRIVGQMGCEPFIAALDHGAELIVAGRAYDPAPFAAVPIREGLDPALALHLGKILECGALCAEPGTTKDAILGTLREEDFLVEPLSDERRCTPTSVAAHTLYEKHHPWLHEGPGLRLDLSGCAFAAHTDRCVRVSGSRMQRPAQYTIKLEGAAVVGYRTFTIAGARDPIFIRELDTILDTVARDVQEQYREVPSADYEIRFHVYGKNAVMGELEPHPEPGHEVGIVLDVTARTQALASAICGSTRSTLLHHGYPGRKSTAGNLALLYSPSDIEFGAVYRFTVYHLVDVDDPLELFPIEYRKVA